MKKPFLVLWILIGVFFIFFWIYLPSLSRYRDLKSKQEDIERQIRDLETKIEKVREERDLLKNDVSYLEKVIRDELGLVKPGEIVYKFVEEPAEPPKAPGESEEMKKAAAGTPLGQQSAPPQPPQETSRNTLK